jgi:hypothetical protein
MEHELDAAAARGAEVRVELEAVPYGGDASKRAAMNARTVERLRAHGVDAALVADNGDAHVKAAVLDGVAWLDDRNFPSKGPDLVVRDDDPTDVAAVREAMHGRPTATARLAFTKAAALDLEGDAIDRCAGEVDVASETFSNSAVSAALRRHLAKGDRVRLVVGADALGRSKTQTGAVAALARLGAKVRVAGALDKLAVGDGNAWMGSANATYPSDQTARMSEWGLVTQTPDGVKTVRAAFEREWESGRPFVAPSGARDPAPAK